MKSYGLSTKDYIDSGGINDVCKRCGVKYFEKKVVDDFYLARKKAIQCQTENGYINTVIMRDKYGVSNRMYLVAGGLKNICHQLGLNYVYANIQTDEKHSAKYIIDSAKDFYLKNGYIKQEPFIEHSDFSKTVIKRIFGSFNGLLDAACIPINSKRNCSKNEILLDIKRVINERDSVSSTVYRKYGRYSQSTIKRHFKSWNDALGEIGLRGLNAKHGKQKMLSDMLRLYDKYGFISKELVNSQCDYTYEAVSVSFGGACGITHMLGVDDAFKPRVSSGHAMIRNVLCNLYTRDGFVEEAQFDWLINDQTNKHMRMDFYIPSINTCIEYQGSQHYKRTRWFHKSDEDFNNSKHRDELKIDLCKKNNVRLVHFNYTEKITQELVAEKLR